MPRRAGITNSLTKGVLDPDLSERIDLQHYYNALADGVNLEIRPQGGVSRRAGWSGNQRLRRLIEPVQVTSNMITAHNGGTPANLVDQQWDTAFETTNDVSGSLFVVAEIDLGTEQDIVFFDVMGFAAENAGRDDCLGVQWYDGSSWVYVAGSDDPDLSPRKNIRTSERTRRFGAAPGVSISARHWRIVITGGSGLGGVWLRGIQLWREKRQLSPVQVFSSARSTSIVYELVLTGRNIDVFRARKYVASIPVPVAAHQVSEVNLLRSIDTHLLFHEDVPTPLIVRQGQHDEWQVSTTPFENIPELVPGNAFSGDQNEIQEITLPGIEAGDQFVVWCGDLVTAPITYTGTSGIASAVASALVALPEIGSGIVASLVDETEMRLRIEFDGSNADRAWPALEAVVLGRDDIVTGHTVIQPGLDASGTVWGATSGWPRCGVFTQGRLLLAGFRAAPTSWAASMVGAFYDFTDSGDPLTADKGFLRTLDTEEVETIQQVYVGRHLQFFTDSSEWNIESRTLDATQPPNATRSTGEGIKSSVRVSFVEGATVFVQQGGRTLRDFLFNDIEGAYKAEPLSLLAPHLLTDVVSIAHRKARSTSEGNMVFMVNADGSLVLLSMLRAQEVIGMCRHETDGAFRSVATNLLNEVVAAVERETVDGPDLYLEVRDETTPLDAAVRFQFETPTAELTGLHHLTGKEAWAYADGELLGPLTVEEGDCSLEVAARDVTIGLMPVIYGGLPKIRDKLQNGDPFRAPARIYELEMSLKDTGPFEIRVNGGSWREVGLTFMDGGPLDPGQLAPSENGYGPELPLMQRLLTGDVVVTNLRGWSRHPTIEFRQRVPAPFHMKALRYELAMRG